MRHLKNLSTRPLYIAILASWTIAFVEYCFQVPANRIGHAVYSLPQLKILQENRDAFRFRAVRHLLYGQPVKLDYVWAGLCMCGAVYFMFRS